MIQYRPHRHKRPRQATHIYTLNVRWRALVAVLVTTGAKEEVG